MIQKAKVVKILNIAVTPRYAKLSVPKISQPKVDTPLPPKLQPYLSVWWKPVYHLVHSYLCSTQDTILLHHFVQNITRDKCNNVQVIIPEKITNHKNAILSIKQNRKKIYTLSFITASM